MTPFESEILRDLFIQQTEMLRHLRAIDGALRIIYRKEYEMARTMQEVLDDVAQERTIEGSLVTLVGNLKKQLDDVLSSTNVPPAVQAQIDATFAAIEANKELMAHALIAGTPADPAPPDTTPGAAAQDPTVPPAPPAEATPDTGAAVKGNQL